MINHLQFKIETEEGVFKYEFGTHIKNVNNNLNYKLKLNRKEILVLKEKVKDLVNELLSGTIKNTLQAPPKNKLEINNLEDEEILNNPELLKEMGVDYDDFE